jgi:hypothetical protein
MPNVADDRWPQLRGGYRTPFDPGRLLAMLQSNTDSSKTWDELWNELHHQGDVGEASYAAVRHLVQLYLATQTIDWNTYALVATIELARGKSGNPEVQDWLSAEYFRAIQDLARKGFSEDEILDFEEQAPGNPA